MTFHSNFVCNSETDCYSKTLSSLSLFLPLALSLSLSLFNLCVSLPQPMFSVTPSLATNATAAAAAAAFNPYLGPVSPGLVPTEILPSAPVLVTSSPNVPVPAAAAAAAAQKLMRTDRLEVNAIQQCHNPTNTFH